MPGLGEDASRVQIRSLAEKRLPAGRVHFALSSEPNGAGEREHRLALAEQLVAAPLLLLVVVPVAEAAVVELGGRKEVQRLLHHRHNLRVSESLLQHLKRVAQRLRLAGPSHHEGGALFVGVLPEPREVAALQPARLRVAVFSAHDLCEPRKSIQAVGRGNLNRGAHGAAEPRSRIRDGKRFHEEPLLDHGPSRYVQVGVVVRGEALLLRLHHAAASIRGAGSGEQHQLGALFARHRTQGPPLVGEVRVRRERGDTVQRRARAPGGAWQLSVSERHGIAVLLIDRFLARCAGEDGYAAALGPGRVAVVENARQQDVRPLPRGLKPDRQRHLRRHPGPGPLEPAHALDGARGRAVSVLQQPGSAARVQLALQNGPLPGRDRARGMRMAPGRRPPLLPVAGD